MFPDEDVPVVLRLWVWFVTCGRDDVLVMKLSLRCFHLGFLHHLTFSLFSNQVHLGSNQWIFNAQLSETKPPAICLRHDVDGLLWQPSDQHAAGGELWEHTATFSALGYVQASKTNRKFSTCAPNVSYACISDCNKHIYIYWQPTPVPSPLRNRKTGREVGAVAKQQVISLDTADSILGLQATNERLFILTENVFFIIRMVK